MASRDGGPSWLLLLLVRESSIRPSSMKAFVLALVRDTERPASNMSRAALASCIDAAFDWPTSKVHRLSHYRRHPSQGRAGSTQTPALQYNHVTCHVAEMTIHWGAGSIGLLLCQAGQARTKALLWCMFMPGASSSNTSAASIAAGRRMARNRGMGAQCRLLMSC